MGHRHPGQGPGLARGAALVRRIGCIQRLLGGDGDVTVQRGIMLRNAVKKILCQLTAGELARGQAIGQPGHGQGMKAH